MLGDNRPVIVFDLDDTICYPNHDAKDTKTKYSMAAANDEVISRMHYLSNAGYCIIIHSARRMLTHNGDIDKIHEDVWDVTVDWLSRAAVPYDELVFGKPYANTYYVDDKAMNLSDFEEWVDHEVCDR